MSDNELELVPISAPRKIRSIPLPVIFGIARTELNPLERSFFEDANPFGFILFKRNCETPEQIRWLVKEIKHTVGRDDVPILIDQEGGRVSRLQPPHWPKYPPPRVFGLMYEQDPVLAAEAIHLYARIIAHELTCLGITVNCAPVVDLLFDGASAAIGDRAFSRKPAVVAALARLWAEVSLQNGVLPVIKHLPGLGRIKTDPHDMLPAIEASRAELEAEDFVPFELLKDLPIAMNSHAVYTALDPERPASMSSRVHQDVIRGHLGFDGIVLSDDLTMKALHGSADDLALRALNAGADVALHCSGNLNEMQAIARVLEPMGKETIARWSYAKSMVRPADPHYKPKEDMARLDILLGAIAYETNSVA